MKKLYRQVDVVMVTEAGFPFVKGGVGGVVDQTIKGMPNTSFGVIHISWDRQTAASLKYLLPNNLLWVFPVYLSPSELDGKNMLRPLGKWWRSSTEHRAVTKLFFDGLDSANGGNFLALTEFFFDFVNPETRRQNFWSVCTTREFLIEFEARFVCFDMPLTETFWLTRNFFSLAYAMSRHRYPSGKIYHSQTQLYAGAIAAIASLQNDRPMVLTEHSLNVRDSINYIFASNHSAGVKSAWQHWFRVLGLFVYQHASGVSYQYQRNVNDATLYGLRPEKVKMISNGIRPSDFDVAKEKQKLRNSLDTENVGLRIWTISYVGRIIEAKGILDLIQAAVILRDTANFSFVLHLIGPADGSEDFKATCEQVISQANLQTTVRFRGAMDLTVALGEVDIVILPSHAEALPIVLLEAMAASVPIIATDVGAISQVISDAIDAAGVQIGAAGIIVPPKSPEDLARAIVRLVKNQTLRAEFRANGPKRIDHSHRAKNVMQAYAEFYQAATFLQKEKYSGKDAIRKPTHANQTDPVADIKRTTRLNVSNEMDC